MCGNFKKSLYLLYDLWYHIGWKLFFNNLNKINGGFLTNLNQIKEFLMSSKSDIKYYVAVSLIIIPIFYTLGLAPFHSLIEDKIGKSILPVSHYFSIIIMFIMITIILQTQLICF